MDVIETENRVTQFKTLCRRLILIQRWGALEALLTSLPYLEGKVASDMVFELVEDVVGAVKVLPPDRPIRRILQLLEEALRRDLHFIARHPSALFQCLWNSCWWHDCKDALPHFATPGDSFVDDSSSQERAAERLSALLERWRAEKERMSAGFPWVRSLRPPPLPLGASPSRVFSGNKDDVMAVAFSSDGMRLASAGGDGLVRVWDTISTRELACFEGHGEPVLGVAFFPDNSRLVSTGRDRTLRIWNIITKGQELKVKAAQRLSLLRVAEDGCRIWGLGADGVRCYVFNGPSAQETVCYPIRGIYFGDLSPDGRQHASFGSEGDPRRYYISVRDSTTQAELVRLVGHSAEITTAAFSPDGQRLASGAWDSTVRIWDLASGQELTCVRSPEQWLRSVVFSPDGRQVAATDDTGIVRVWDANDGKEIASLPAHGGKLHALVFSPDVREPGRGGGERLIRMLDVPDYLVGIAKYIRLHVAEQGDPVLAEFRHRVPSLRRGRASRRGGERNHDHQKRQ